MSAVLEKDAAPKTASLAQLRNPGAPESSMPVVRMGFETLQSFELMQRAAKLLASSSLVPKEYIGNIPNCVIALNMAQRIGADPLMVMQNLYVVHGRPGWSSKFLIASFNQCGRFSAIRFEWFSERTKDEWGCKAWATEKATGEKIHGPLITIGLSKKEGWYEKSGSKWKTIPELMLMYRSAGWLVNTHAPEISMGLNTVEELGDVFNAAAGADGTYVVTQDDLRTVDKTTGEILEQQAAEPERTDEVVADKKAEDAPDVDPVKLLARIEAATTTEECDDAATLIGSVPDFDRRNKLTVAYQKRRTEIIAAQAAKAAKK